MLTWVCFFKYASFLYVCLLPQAWKADEAGNLVFRKTARNFNEPMACAVSCTARTCARVTLGVVCGVSSVIEFVLHGVLAC